MKELNLFDSRTNIHRHVTGERLLEFFHFLSILILSAVLFKSIEGMSIAISMNFTLTNVATEVVVGHKNSSNDKKITLLLRKFCFTNRNSKTLRKNPGPVIF